jgi:hypothetical protein
MAESNKQLVLRKADNSRTIIREQNGIVILDKGNVQVPVIDNATFVFGLIRDWLEAGATLSLEGPGAKGKQRKRQPTKRDRLDEALGQIRDALDAQAEVEALQGEFSEWHDSFPNKPGLEEIGDALQSLVDALGEVDNACDEAEGVEW